AWTTWRYIARLVPAFHNDAFLKAFRSRDVAMKLDNARAAGALVQSIHVLSDQRDVGEAALHFRQRHMARVGLRSRHQLPAPGVPFPDPAGIPSKRLGRGELLWFEAGPHSGLRIAKRRHPALC